MASSMMHYIISNQILKKYPDVDNNKFLFGATLGPDASSHDDGTYDIAHFGSVENDKKGIDWQKFEQKHGDKMLEDGFYLGYWCHLIQDAVWFHDVVDKYVRVFEGEKKKECYQKGYRDYGRLNYLLQKSLCIFFCRRYRSRVLYRIVGVYRKRFYFGPDLLD